jgi:hypothetical protein
MISAPHPGRLVASFKGDVLEELDLKLDLRGCSYAPLPFAPLLRCLLPFSWPTPWSPVVTAWWSLRHVSEVPFGYLFPVAGAKKYEL